MQISNFAPTLNWVQTIYQETNVPVDFAVDLNLNGPSVDRAINNEEIIGLKFYLATDVNKGDAIEVGVAGTYMLDAASADDVVGPIDSSLVGL